MSKTFSFKIIFRLSLGLFILTSCGVVMCSMCRAMVENKSTKDIYVILLGNDKNFNIKTSERMAIDSKINWYQVDTVKNTGMFRISPNGFLKLYEGPGDNPARILSQLKILTEKRIFEFKTQGEVNNAFRKSDGIYKITVAD